MYGCLDAMVGTAEVMERVGDGVEAESQPFSGDVGNITVFSGSASAVWGVDGESTDTLDANIRP